MQKREEQGAARSQPCGAPKSAATEAQPSGAFTPGPWFWALDKHNQCTSLMRSGSGDYVVSPQSEQSNYGLSSHEWNDVSEADARLIAAAPELLEALKECAEALECERTRYSMRYGEDAEDIGASDALKAADAAIAKAEGRA